MHGTDGQGHAVAVTVGVTSRGLMVVRVNGVLVVLRLREATRVIMRLRAALRLAGWGAW